MLLAFGWSWINWFIGLYFLSAGINDESIDHFVRYFFIGVYGPVIASIITTLTFGGLSETFALFKKIFIWKFPVFNYLAAFILPLLFLGSGIALYSLFIGSPGNIGEQAALAIPFTLWRALFAGPLGEELGWRGFLLPELQENNSAIKSSVILGAIHCVWHLPLFWAPFGSLPSGQPFSALLLITYLVLVICWSCVQTWLVNSSKGSVLIAILFHLFINVGIVLIFFPEIYTDANKAKLVYYLSTVLTIPFTIFLCVKTKLNSRLI